MCYVPPSADSRPTRSDLKDQTTNGATGPATALRATASPETGRRRLSSRWSFYVWVAVVLGVCVAAVILAWHSSGGTPDPSVAGNHMSRTSAVINSAILVFREGLETILVLAAVMASFLGTNRVYRRPVAIGASFGVGATVATWFAAI